MKTKHPLVMAEHVIASQFIEVHVVGEHVAITWELSMIPDNIEQNGVVYSATIPTRVSAPALSFLSVCQRGPEINISGRDPLSEPLDLSAARALAVELNHAIEYLAWLENHHE